MTQWSRYISVHPASGAARLLVVLAVLPTLVLSPASVSAILIHDHQGYDSHTHSLLLSEVDSWRDNLERCHGDSKRHGSPDDSAGEEDCTVVIVVEIPDALPKVRGPYTGAVVARGFAPSPLPVALAADPAASSSTLHSRPWSAWLTLCASSTVAGIILTNHALLL